MVDRWRAMRVVGRWWGGGWMTDRRCVDDGQIEDNESGGKIIGHRYLGLGNPLRNGDPEDEDDGIVKSHDEGYERATSHEDVFAADQASVALFLNDFRRTGICRVKKGEANNPMKPQPYTSFQEKDHADLAKNYWGF
ncbi:hypothetical protein MRX96_022047 [Rhipicephalus microplus]